MKPVFILFIVFVAILGCKPKKEETLKVVINKERTIATLIERLAKQTGKPQKDFADFLNNADSLKTIGKNAETLMSSIIPNTFEVYKKWNAGKIIKKITDYEKAFWTETRAAQAQKLNLTTHQVVTLASIVEEETNNKDDKGKVASVYLNRLTKGMKLEADPTIKYALNNFALKRIINKDKEASKNSPYNTYFAKGLPPGPICTPAPSSIDAVLTAPSTDYIFFVAQPNNSGLSNFTNNLAQHNENAKAYQKYLDQIKITKGNRQ